MAEECIQIHLGKVMNETPTVLTEKINTHNIYVFVFYIERCYLDSCWDNNNILKIYVPPTRLNISIWDLNDYVPHPPSPSSSSAAAASASASSPDQHILVKLEHVNFFKAN